MLQIVHTSNHTYNKTQLQLSKQHVLISIVWISDKRQEEDGVCKYIAHCPLTSACAAMAETSASSYRHL